MDKVVEGWFAVAMSRTPKISDKLPVGTLDSVRMNILADALLDAGCDNEEMIAHCRSSVSHVRGCWVVDLILGKS